MIPKSLFFAPKNKRLAKAISIRSPRAFRNSINRLKVRGLSMQEKRALTLAKTRAKLQLRRRNLSLKEKRQFRMISKMRIPQITKSY